MCAAVRFARTFFKVKQALRSEPRPYSATAAFLPSEILFLLGDSARWPARWDISGMRANGAMPRVWGARSHPARSGPHCDLHGGCIPASLAAWQWPLDLGGEIDAVPLRRDTRRGGAGCRDPAAGAWGGGLCTTAFPKAALGVGCDNVHSPPGALRDQSRVRRRGAFSARARGRTWIWGRPVVAYAVWDRIVDCVITVRTRGRRPLETFQKCGRSGGTTTPGWPSAGGQS